MLGASGRHTGDTYAFSGVLDGSGASGVAQAAMLLPLADAAIGGTDEALAEARALAIAALGSVALTDAAAVIGGFDGITRVADATGIPLDARVAGPSASWRAELGIDRFEDEKV